MTKGERNVQRMILYFEVDDMMRIFLLKATEIVTREDSVLRSKVVPDTLLPVFGRKPNRHLRSSSVLPSGRNFDSKMKIGSQELKFNSET